MLHKSIKREGRGGGVNGRKKKIESKEGGKEEGGERLMKTGETKIIGAGTVTITKVDEEEEKRMATNRRGKE